MMTVVETVEYWKPIIEQMDAEADRHRTEWELLMLSGPVASEWIN